MDSELHETTAETQDDPEALAPEMAIAIQASEVARDRLLALEVELVSELVGQPANDLQRGRKSERMKEEEGTIEEQASDGKTSERGFAVVQQARRTGTAAGREGDE